MSYGRVGSDIPTLLIGSNMIYFSLPLEDEDRLIIADTSEERGLREISSTSRLQFHPSLEEWTGADIMVTPLERPLAPVFLKDHLAAGALLIQRKSGLDIAASVGERMYTSLERMLALPTCQAQRILLFIGHMNCTREGKANINGQDVPLQGESYWSIRGSIAKWQERGGCYDEITRIGLLPRWLQLREAHLKEFQAHPQAVFYKSQPPLEMSNQRDVLQDLVVIKDWRTSLVTFPGVGAKRLQALLDQMQLDGAEISLLQCLHWLTTWDLIKKVPGMGKSVFTESRRWLGLSPGESLEVVSSSLAEAQET